VSSTRDDTTKRGGATQRDDDSGGKSAEVKARLDKVDDFQQRHKVPAIAIATFKKFSEDQSTNLASMIAFWAFFSIFPLFLVLVTLLGFFLPTGTKNSVLHNISQMLPLINPQTVSGLHGSWWALIVGILTALWSGTGVVRTIQTAFNSVWEVPMKERPKLVEQVGRSVLVLVTLGLGIVLTTLISGLITGTANDLHLGWFAQLAGYVITIALDVGLFIAAYRILTDRDVSVRDVLPGALLAGVVFWVLQQLSSFIISSRLQSAGSTYGTFATVITILWWFYIQGIVSMLGAQLNVVLKENLWPRGLVGVPDTEADTRAYDAYAKEKTFHDNQVVDSDFTEQGTGSAEESRSRR
jgi:YihY family inner membrane protein